MLGMKGNIAGLLKKGRSWVTDLEAEVKKTQDEVR